MGPGTHVGHLGVVMEFLGRYQRGDVVPIPVITANATPVPTLPGAAPVAYIYKAGTFLEAVKLPIKDRYLVTAFFLFPLFLGAKYTAAHYQVWLTYSVSSTVYATVATFEVVSSGNKDGDLVSLTTKNFPAVAHALGQTRSGRIRRFTNPRAL